MDLPFHFSISNWIDKKLFYSGGERKLHLPNVQMLLKKRHWETISWVRTCALLFSAFELRAQTDLSIIVPIWWEFSSLVFQLWFRRPVQPRSPEWPGDQGLSYILRDYVRICHIITIMILPKLRRCIGFIWQTQDAAKMQRQKH